MLTIKYKIMKKGYLVGGLAIVGAIALLMYLRPKARRNSEGFFGANGRGGFATSTGRVPLCLRREKDGTGTQYTSQGGDNPCPYGGRIV